MPMRALSACSEPGCSVLLVRPGKCAQHARKPWAQTLTRHERGYGTEWDAIRRVVLAEEPWCQEMGCSARATTVDHRTPKAEGGTNDRSNLRALCSACQQRKAGREGARARSNRLNP